MALSDEIANMHDTMSDDEIIRTLVERGHTPVEILDAFNRLKLKPSGGGKEGLKPSIMQQDLSVPTPAPTAAVTEAEAAEAPQVEAAAYYPYAYPTTQVQPQTRIDTETIEEITEEIVSEKWQEFKSKIGDISEWKLYMENRTKGIDDRLKRLELSMDKLQAALLGKVQEYGQNIKDLGAEVQSLETAFSKVLDPLLTNIKELSKITEQLKKGKTPEKSKNSKNKK
jgi:hypothetical protein